MARTNVILTNQTKFEVSVANSKIPLIEILQAVRYGRDYHITEFVATKDPLQERDMGYKFRIGTKIPFTIEYADKAKEEIELNVQLSGTTYFANLFIAKDRSKVSSSSAFRADVDVTVYTKGATTELLFRGNIFSNGKDGYLEVFEYVVKDILATTAMVKQQTSLYNKVYHAQFDNFEVNQQEESNEQQPLEVTSVNLDEDPNYQVALQMGSIFK